MTEAGLYNIGSRLEFQFLDIEILFSEVSTAAILTRVLVQFELARQLRHTADAAGLVFNFRLGLHFGGVVFHLVHVFMFCVGENGARDIAPALLCVARQVRLTDSGEWS